MSKLTLGSIELNDKLFYKILKDYKIDVEITDNIHFYYSGYSNKSTIYYNGRDEFICLEYIVGYYTNAKYNCTRWRQIRVRLNQNADNKADKAISGSSAYAYILKLLYKYYTKAEIEHRLHMFEADYDQDLAQLHFIYPVEKVNTIVRLDNTYKYDINGAHLDALCEIFPKAKDAFIDMYEKRKKNPVFKQYPNLFVGYLAKKTKKMRQDGKLGKFEKTYNWIVQRTTKKMIEALNVLGGYPVYINTDGVAIYLPQAKIETSKKLGEFKLEYSGTTYVYRDKNYVLYQFGKEKKGSCFTEIKEKADLSKGEVLHYDIHVVKDDQGKILCREPINIMKEIIEINGKNIYEKD